MNWLDGLLEPLLDRLALKLAIKVRAELDGAIDAALDRADDRIDTAFEGLDERLQAAATKRIADMKVTLGQAPQLQPQIEAIGPERLQVYAEAAGMIPAKEMNAQIAFAASSASDAARDHLRSRLTPPRPWKEIPDR
jgi:hypothetical protein